MSGTVAPGGAVVTTQQLVDLAAQAQDASLPANPSKEQFYASVPLPDPSRCIRVLDLYPAERFRQNSPLVGHLRVVDLDRTPSFTTLSYVWGSEAQPCDTILCQPQGCHLKITANCHSALWSLRKRFGTLTIWVDSVCINQGDKDEKAAQIPLMGRIYTGSERLFVWLGPGNETSDTAMDYLAQLAKLRTRLPFHLVMSPNWPTGRGQMFLHMWLARLRTLSEAPARLRVFLTHRWMAQQVRLDELFTRDWIRRAWTFQELILSPNPVVLCGDKILAWEELIDFVVSSQDYFDSNTDGFYLNLLGKRPRASADSLTNWSSAIMLWLTFSRRGSPSNNLAKLVRLDRANRIVRWIKFTLGVLLIPPTIFGYLVVYVRLIIAVAYVIGGAERFLLIFLAEWVIWVGTIVWQIRFLATIMRACWRLIFGLRPPWCGMAGNQQQETGSGMLHVEGIRVALRERAVTQPHDKVFSTLAILKTLGLEEVEIDYRRPLSECFKHLFVAVVKLHPPALLMLCDAGLPQDSERWTGPSWVPNWMATPPNAGVSSQLHIPARRRLDDTNFSPGDLYEVKGDLLRVDETELIGQISSHGPLDDCNVRNWDPLQRVYTWYGFIRMNSVHLPTICTNSSFKELEEEVKEQYRDSVVFAALEGLPCPQERKQPVFAEVAADDGDVRTMQRRPHEAPLNFSDLKREFNDFLKFRAMLDESCSAELPSGHDIVQLLRRKLNGDGGAARYCDRLMAKLAKDDRAFIVVAVEPYASIESSHITEGYWIGTAPLAAMPGDYVFQLPKVEGCMVLRRISNSRKYQVVGCALLPMFTANRFGGITLI